MRRLHHTTFFLLIYLGMAVCSCLAAGNEYPFMGDWQGRWDAKDRVYPPKLAAQVFPWKNGSYQIRLFTELRKGAPEYVMIEAKPDGDVLNFNSSGWSGKIQGNNLTGGGTLRGKSGRFRMNRVVYESPRLGLKLPRNARILFNGGSLDELEMIQRTGDTGPVTWAVEGDALKIVPEQGNHQMGASIGTKRTFDDFQLHIEFRLPLLPNNTDQRRGNSGVIIEEFQFFEVQVLDSYGLPGYYDECGAIYQIAPPKFNMCLMPMQWQSYDITYRAPRFDRNGDLTEAPRITVNHNGVLIHNDLELPYSDNAIRARKERPDSRKVGRIKLQDHGYPVQYRNIWIVEK